MKNDCLSQQELKGGVGYTAGTTLNVVINLLMRESSYCLVVATQFGVTSVTAWPPDTAADSPFTSYSLPPLSSVVEPYENDRPVFTEPAEGTVAFHQPPHAFVISVPPVESGLPYTRHCTRTRDCSEDGRYHTVADFGDSSLNVHFWFAPLPAFHSCTFAPLESLPPYTSRASDLESADTRRYESPSLTAIHFWLRPLPAFHCSTFAPALADAPATSSARPEFTFLNVT